MKILLKPFQWLYCIYAFALFIGIMLLIFPFAILASFFGKIKGGNMIIRLCMLWSDLWFPLIFIFHKKIHRSPLDNSKTYIFVSNHASYLDAAILVKAFRQPFRPLGKVEMAKVPIFGFIYRNAIVTVDRTDSIKRAGSVRILKSVLIKGFSIMVFPEGTFNMTDKPLKSFFDGAFRIAIETQTPIKPVLFLDARKRMHSNSIFTLNPGRSRLLYLDEIPVEGLSLKDVNGLKQRVYDLMEQALLTFAHL
jgi:1-acyl-sn-glycerol-3-phosphate acyltransferase